MAILEPRLLDLIETLVAARLDWLAFEVIDGVKAGRPSEESETTLAAARASIRSKDQPKARGEPVAVVAEAKPIPTDEQIEWAAAYVEERLDEAIGQLQASLDTLDFIVENTTEKPDGGKVAGLPADLLEPKAVAVLLDIEGDRKSGRDNVTEARENLAALRSALGEWVSLSRGQMTI